MRLRLLAPSGRLTPAAVSVKCHNVSYRIKMWGRAEKPSLWLDPPRLRGQQVLPCSHMVDLAGRVPARGRGPDHGEPSPLLSPYANADVTKRSGAGSYS